MVFASTATLWRAADAAAQRRRPPRRVIVLEESCGGGLPRADPEWLVTPPDRCPGATLLRLCGGAARPGCPTITEAATALGDDALDRCSAEPALLGPANALYEDYSDRASLGRAERVLLVASRAPSIRSISLYVAARAAHRASRYDATLRALGALLSNRPSPALTRAARDLYARALLYDDWNEDQVPDTDFGVARFSPASLPDAPWAFGVALVALHDALDWYVDRFFAEAVAEVQRRWPAEAAEKSAELDALLTSYLERQRDFERLGAHLLAAAARCRAHAASHPTTTSCEGATLDHATGDALRGISSCRGDIVRPETLDACAAAIAQGRRVLAVRPSASVALDVDDAQRWLEASRARAALRPRARRSVAAPPDPTLRTELPSANDTYTTTGELDPWAFRRAVDADALRACAPAQATAIGFSIDIARDGRVTSAADTEGATATCVRAVLERTRGPLPEGGPSRFRAFFVFAPRTPSAR